jgi:hypothetical protein
MKLIKRRLRVIFVFVIILTSSTLLYSQQKEEFGKKQIGRERLSDNKNDKNDKSDKFRNPGGPGGPGEPGGELPIGNGFMFLAGLSTAYLIINNRRNKKQ